MEINKKFKLLMKDNLFVRNLNRGVVIFINGGDIGQFGGNIIFKLIQGCNRQIIYLYLSILL